jgi:predicted aspartyl protease
MNRLIALALLLAAPTATVDHVRELVAKDRWTEALAEARALAAETPGSDAGTALGEALYRAGQIDDAGEVLAPIAASDDAPARALAQLGLVRAAQGNDREALALMERAAAKAPRDPWVVYRASGAARTRARAVELLETYLELAAGDDPDRLEGARGTIRLDRALGERNVWVPLASPERLEVPLKPLVGTGGGFFVEATIANGKKIRLLLDTGSTGLFVVERAVKKGGLTPLSEETVFAGGGEGRASSSRGLLAKLAIGGLQFADALVTTTKDEFDPQGRIHGVLGLNVFSGYRVTMNLAKGRLQLAPCGDDATGAPYWDVGGQMLVNASAVAGPDGLFLFDTGATRSMLARSFVERVQGALVERAATVRTYGGNVGGASTVRGVKLRFQDVEGRGTSVFTSDLTQRSRLGGVEVSGFLGMDLLDRTTIVVDTRARRVAVVSDAPKP